MFYNKFTFGKKERVLFTKYREQREYFTVAILKLKEKMKNE